METSEMFQTTNQQVFLDANISVNMSTSTSDSFRHVDIVDSSVLAWSDVVKTCLTSQSHEIGWKSLTGNHGFDHEIYT